MPLLIYPDYSYPDFKKIVPKKYQAAVKQKLDLAGKHALILYSALQKLTVEEQGGASFLIANMPLIDLTEMDSTTFLEHIRYAYKVRQEFPWAKTLPEDKFLHYVLPYRMSQEPIEKWRKYFYEKLYPIVNGLKTPAEVAIKINEWCGQQIKFKPTQRRDQGPFETLKSGYGRCEEMMIFYVAAARSVGIAARQTWTPYWPKMDNNHAWVEVWDGISWSYLGACEPAPVLNRAWFDNAVKDAAFVFASVFGVPDNGEEIYRKEKNFAIINSTPNYVSSPVRLKIVLTANKKNLSNVPIYIYVFNFGALRPIARLTSDKNGSAMITINQGEYFISAAWQESSYFNKIMVDEQNKKVELDLIQPQFVSGSYWLNYEKK